jgi:hypothetical protein
LLFFLATLPRLISAKFIALFNFINYENQVDFTELHTYVHTFFIFIAGGAIKQGGKK